MDKTLELDMDNNSVSTENDMSHHDMGDHHVIQSYSSMNESSASMKMNNTANYLGRSRVFLDGHMSIDKSTGVTVIFCSYCQKTWTSPKSSSTGNYRKHLMKHHPYELSGKDGVVGQVRLRDGLLRWMIQSAVGIETFDENFNQFLRSSFHVEIGKSRLSQSLLEILDKQYELSKSKVQTFFRTPMPSSNPTGVYHIAVSYHHKSILSLCDSNSLIQNIPQPSTSSGPASTNFLAVAGHYINEQWQLKNIMLGFVPVRGYLSPKIIAGQISDQLGQYLDLTQITSIVSNSATGEVLLPQESMNHGLSKYKVFCIASLLQAGVLDATMRCLSPLTTSSCAIPALDKLRAVVVDMYASPKNLDILNRIHIQIANAQASANPASELTYIDVDHASNWRSTLKLVSSAMEHRTLIETFLNQQARAAGSAYHPQAIASSTSIVQLLHEDWRELHFLRQCLQTFDTVIVALTNPSQDLPTIPTVLPSLGWISDVMNEVSSDVNLSPGLNQFVALLKAHVQHMQAEVKQCRIYAIASALDPRLKLDFFDDGQWNEEDKAMIVQELGNLFSYYSQMLGSIGHDSSTSAATMSVLPGSNDVDTDGSNIFYKRRKVSNKQEWEVYLSTPVSSVDKQDPLSWWKEHSTSYPILAEMIKNVFAIPASMAYAETSLNQGVDMIARFRRQRAIAQQKKEQPLPLGQNQRPSIHAPGGGTTASGGGSSSSNASAAVEEILFVADERSVEEVICLQSWIGSIIPDE